MDKFRKLRKVNDDLVSNKNIEENQVRIKIYSNEGEIMIQELQVPLSVTNTELNEIIKELNLDDEKIEKYRF